MKTDINELRSKIIEEAKDRRQRPAEKDEITAAMLAKELGCSGPAARRTLRHMVRDGRATVRTNGPKNSNIYKYIE